jgi:TonB family protein
MNSNASVHRKKALNELLLWLICIWMPVLYIYGNTSRTASPPASLPARQVPLDKRPAPSAKQELPTPQQHSIKKEKHLTDIQGMPRTPSANSVNEKGPKSSGENQAANNLQEADSRPRQVFTVDPAATQVPETETEAILEAKGTNSSVDMQNLLRNDLPSAKKPYKAPANPYLAMVQRRISREWHAPAINEQLETVVRFKLEKSGYVSEVEIEESSGNEYFDLAAKRTVLATNPLPSFFAEMEGDYLYTHLRFSNENLKDP